MRKLALVAALAVAVSAGAAQAQGGPPGGRGRGGPGGPGGRGGPGGAPMGMLLRGIELTDAQKAQLVALRPDSATMEKNREASTALFEQIRAARQSGDSAKAASLMQEQRKLMDAQRDKQAAELRGILTADQQVVFDKNLADQKEREAQGGGFGGPGGRGRGMRPPPPPPAA